MALLGQFLFENGFAYWDLGMSLPYKYRYGAKDCDRETQSFYHSTLSKNRIPFPADKTFSIADIWENLSHSKSFLEMAPVHREEKISTKPEDLIPFAEPNTKYKDFGRQISEIDFSYSGDISLQRLYSAYMQGVFPWWNEEDNEPPAWYSPDPRFVIMTEEYHCPSSLKKFMKKCPYTFTMDQCFHKVITECARMKRTDQDGTWIGPKMIKAYTKFHKAGYAHSFEVWHKGKLAGGFYGVLIGKIFFGESMFTIEDNSSKCVYSLFMKAFAECGGVMVDCQVYTDNMARYGGKNISRDAFLHIEKENLLKPLNKDLKETFNSLAEAFRRNM